MLFFQRKHYYYNVKQGDIDKYKNSKQERQQIPAVRLILTYSTQDVVEGKKFCIKTYEKPYMFFCAFLHKKQAAILNYKGRY